MNENKKAIVIGRMKSGEHRFHIEDDVLDTRGISRPMTATDYKHPVCILEEREDDGDYSDRQHMR